MEVHRTKTGRGHAGPSGRSLRGWGSTHVEQGFLAGVYNSRGATLRDPSEGGASERALAERYEGFAAAIRATYPRTAGMLREIGALYRRDASLEDFDSEMGEEL